MSSYWSTAHPSLTTILLIPNVLWLINSSAQQSLTNLLLDNYHLVGQQLFLVLQPSYWSTTITSLTTLLLTRNNLCTHESLSNGGLEWLVGAVVSLSLRARSCWSKVPGGLKNDRPKYRRAAELPGQSTIVVLSCCWAHGEGSKLLGQSTTGMLSAPAYAPEGCWVHLPKYHYDTTGLELKHVVQIPALSIPGWQEDRRCSIKFE